jgi:hypothetical protein
MKHPYLYLLVFIMLVGVVWADGEVKITHLKGDVRIRVGLDEDWQKARIGMILKNLDTIYSGENSSVILLNQDGQKFTLQAHSILDISDLREIQERELFLFLMTQKVDQIDIKDTGTKIRVGNVSVVHGESKKDAITTDLSDSNIDWYTFEMNGAKALIAHTYYPNAIIKLHQIRNRYSEERDQGFASYQIGSTFEAMDNIGQAMDNYQTAITQYAKYNPDTTSEPGWVKESREAIDRLRDQ